MLLELRARLVEAEWAATGIASVREPLIKQLTRYIAS